MTEHKGEELAARLRAAIELQEADRAEAETEAAARRTRQAAARRELMDALAAFGESVGVLTVNRVDDDKGDVLELRRDERVLRFEPKGESNVAVSGDEVNDQPEIFLEEQLNRWVVAPGGRAGARDGRLLFDQGLSLLVATAFGVDLGA